MKTILILVMLLFTGLSGRIYAQSTSLSQLNEGDWFDLQYIRTNSTNSEFSVTTPWMAENTLKISFRSSVIQKKKHAITLCFRPVRYYFNQQEAKRDQQLYFDSYYTESESPFSLVSQDSILITLEIKKGKIEHVSTILSDTTSYIGCKTIYSGIKKPNKSPESWQTYSINLETLTQNTLIPLLTAWVKDETIPCRMDFAAQHSTTLITAASFQLPTNTLITCFPLKPLSIFEQKITINEQEYQLTSNKDGSLSCALFLAAPVKTWISHSSLLLTPGDSIQVREINNQETHYSGKGAGNNRFNQCLENQSLCFQLDLHYFFQKRTPQQIKERLEEGNSIYKKLFEKYGAEMNPYWKKSAELSAKYWEIQVYLRADWGQRSQNNSINEQIQIPWNHPSFTSVNPFIDYQYQPEAYEQFTDSFFRYKVAELNKDNLTDKSYWESSPDSYYLQKQIFSGYPRILQLSKDLKNMLEDQDLSKVQQEYNDFITLCKDPKELQQIKDLWNHYLKLEPGANIRDLHLSITDRLPLKKKADGYILLSSSIVFGDPQDFITNPTIDAILKKLNVKEKTSLCYFRPISRKQYLPDSLKNENLYTFLPDDQIELDENLLKLSPWDMILLKNDGTIISRKIHKTEYGINDLETIFKEELNRKEVGKTYTRSEIYNIGIFALCFILGLAASIWGLIRIKLKKTRIQKLIAELELKAIRSQMNPHFIFNALGSIQNLIHQEKSDAANQYLVDFSRLLRTVLSSSEKKLVALSDEMELLTLYLKMEQLRVPFTFDIKADNTLTPDTEEIPGMLIQPIVENAVIHGITPNGGGQINIRFHKENATLYCYVSDSGPGISPDNVHVLNSRKGFGLRATEERLKLLNKEFNTHIGIHIENRIEKEGVNGSLVTIIIPV